jgi:hypothetical protein
LPGASAAVANVSVTVAASLPLVGATVSQLTAGPMTDHLRFFLVVVTCTVRGATFVPAVALSVREFGLTDSVWADAARGTNTTAQNTRHRTSREDAITFFLLIVSACFSF